MDFTSIFHTSFSSHDVGKKHTKNMLCIQYQSNGILNDQFKMWKPNHLLHPQDINKKCYLKNIKPCNRILVSNSLHNRKLNNVGNNVYFNVYQNQNKAIFTMFCNFLQTK